MLSDKQSHFFRDHLKQLIFIFLIVPASLSIPANAIIIEGHIKGAITYVSIEGNRAETPFFNLADIGKPISADFWYEFDESNFIPTESSEYYQGYDFGFLDMNIVFHLGTESFSAKIPTRNMPLTHYRNFVAIVRTPNFSYFDLFAYTEYSASYLDSELRTIDIIFNTETMGYFNEFNLIQNLSMTASENSHFGDFELMEFGSNEFRLYDTKLYGTFNEFTIGVRDSTSVNAPSSLGLLVIALAILGWRHSANNAQRLQSH